MNIKIYSSYILLQTLYLTSVIKHSENFNSQQSSNESSNKFWYYKRATNGETYFLLIYHFFMAFDALRDKERVEKGTSHPIGNPEVIKFP